MFEMVSFTLRGFVYHNKIFFKKIVIRNTCRVKLEILVNENKTMTDGSESKQAGLLDAGSLGGRSVGARWAGGSVPAVCCGALPAL